jgi:hypothetical protein
MQSQTLADLTLVHDKLFKAHSEFIESMYAKYDDDINWSEDWDWDELLTADEYSQYLHLSWALGDAYKAMDEAENPPPTKIEQATNSVLSVFAQALPWAVIAFVLFASNAHL